LFTSLRHPGGEHAPTDASRCSASAAPAVRLQLDGVERDHPIVSSPIQAAKTE
jgi:hypothetical protein